MPGFRRVSPTLSSTSYTADPTLDLGDARARIEAVHMTALGPALMLSFDGVNDDVELDQAEFPTWESHGGYSAVWVRCAAAGTSRVQIIAEFV